MVELIIKIGNIGCEKEYIPLNKRMVIVTNYTALISTVNLLGFAIFYIAYDFLNLTPVYLLLFLFILPILFCIYLNYKKKHLLSSVLLNICITLSVFLPAWIYLGSKFGYQYFFVLFSIIPIITIPWRKTIIIAILSLANIACFILIDNIQPMIDLSIYFSHEVIMYLRILTNFSSFITFILAVWINQLILSRSEMQLYSKTSNLKLELKEFEKLATTDNLTGLFNRNYFDKKIAYELELANKSDLPLSLIMFDIDYFKHVNDNWGHDVGDEVLKRISKVISKNIRTSDTFIRLGGEEFLIIAPQTDINGAIFLAEKLRKVMENEQHNNIGPVTGSFGVAQLIRGETFDMFYKRVDQSLYKAKEHGRNNVVGFKQ